MKLPRFLSIDKTRSDAADATAKRPVAPFPQFLLLGFAGKRRLVADPAMQAGAEESLAAALAYEFSNLQARYAEQPVSLVGISALAMGADTVFAETLLRCGGKLRVFLPERPELFFNAGDFGNDVAILDRSRRILEHSGVIERRVLGGELGRVVRFEQCATDIVDACDVLFVALTAAEWEEFMRWKEGIATIPSSFSPGGSGQTLCQAYRKGRECRVFVADENGCNCYPIVPDEAAL